jgi:hypothetical protein
VARHVLSIKGIEAWGGLTRLRGAAGIPGTGGLGPGERAGQAPPLQSRGSPRDEELTPAENDGVSCTLKDKQFLGGL